MTRLLRFTARLGAGVVLVAAIAAGFAAWWLNRPLPLPSSPYTFDVRTCIVSGSSF